ncbi:hypothetical protein MKS88_005306 [Plasmodium brasilianum]|uniref:Uncharacterized protein n=2 Tax=Plasmodium (Plasmodium) TaxID=418103 RepID=A0A1D3TDZ3_PLAMA|nr:conserved Plasmodium protein, unknown function [Plasmodium malariae]KAI4834632.1 hypothetical protein MKS88_005306 [Plasmodium brasilianum]SCP03172.1 conserved Plasmodium protein, unknown function [Plasmodium malariae]
MKYIERNVPENRSYYEDREHGAMRKEYKTNYKRVLWPINVGIYDVDDKNIKKELCLIVTNIPVYWTKCDITWFFREYFYKLAINDSIAFPLIEQVYLIKNEPSAILACHDGASREIIQSLSSCMLRSVKDEKNILLTIHPYYKKPDEDEKEKVRHRERERQKENEKQDSERDACHVEKNVEIEEEGCNEDKNRTVRNLRKRSLTPPRTENGMEWPRNLDVRSCNNHELRRRLCVFGRYKPLHWGAKELSLFLKYYFETLKRDNANFEIPEISDMWADKGTHLVTFACKNEKSRFNMLLIRACYLNEEDAKNNLKNSLRVWVQFEKWTPYKNSFTDRYKNNKMQRNDFFNKYNPIHEHSIDKNSYKNRILRKPLYDSFSRNKTNSFRTNLNLHNKLNHTSNYIYHKEDRNKRNYNNVKNNYANRSRSPYFNKYKKKYSPSPSLKNYYKTKKFRKSHSIDSRKEEVDSYWSKSNNKPHNRNFSRSFSRK